MNIRRDNGFTFVELLVSVAVFLILVSVGVPGFNQTLLNNRQVSQVNLLVGSMQLARSKAVFSNTRVTVCASDDGASCGNSWSNGWIVFVDSNGDGQRNGKEAALRSVTDVQNLEITPKGIANNFMYRPTGRMMANNNIRANTGQFTVCDIRGAAHARAIVVDSSGRPRASKYNLDGSAPVCRYGE